MLMVFFGFCFFLFLPVQELGQAQLPVAASSVNDPTRFQVSGVLPCGQIFSVLIVHS